MIFSLGGPVLPLKNANIVCDGNSITFGNEPNSYPTILRNKQTLIDNSATVANLAVNGQTTAQMQSDAASQIDPLISPTRPNILIAWEITNHMHFGEGVAVACAAFRSYCLARKLASWRVVILTCLDRHAPPGEDDEQYRAKLNSANLIVLSDWRSYADQIVDVRQIAGFETDNFSNLPDGTHPSAFGCGLIATALLPALERIPLR